MFLPGIYRLSWQRFNSGASAVSGADTNGSPVRRGKNPPYAQSVKVPTGTGLAGPRHPRTAEPERSRDQRKRVLAHSGKSLRRSGSDRSTACSNVRGMRLSAAATATSAGLSLNGTS
jgi:hypothetical protein